MRSAIIFAVLVGAVALAMFLGGVFDSDEPTTNSGGTEVAGTQPGAAERDPDLRARDVNDGVPKTRPAFEFPEFPEGTKALVIGGVPNTPDQFLMTKVLAAQKNVSYHGWYLRPPAGSTSMPIGTNQGLEALEAMPTGLTLDKHDYTLVVISNINPADLPEDFWTVLARRVKSGLSNVLWRAWAPYPSDTAEGSPMVHPYLSHEVIRALLPVQAIADLKGVPTPGGRTRIPGNFGDRGARFVPTEAGVKHVATRLVPWPRWSRTWWNDLGEGKYKLGMKFCVPVTEVVEGAKVLLGAETKGADDIPAVVVAQVGGGRVAWLGTREIAWAPMHNPVAEPRMAVVIHGILAWLAGAD